MNHAIPIEVVNSFKEFHNALPMKMNNAIFSCSDRVVFNMVTWWRASCVCLCLGQIFSCLFFHIHYEVINMTWCHTPLSSLLSHKLAFIHQMWAFISISSKVFHTTYCHVNYLAMLKKSCIFKGGRAGTILRSEGFLNYSQRIGGFIVDNLYVAYRWDENNSKKSEKKFGYMEIISYIYNVND